MVMVMIGAVIAGTRPGDQRPLQVSGDGPVRIGFLGHQGGDALCSEPLAQTGPHAGRDEDLHVVQRMRFLRRAFMEGLLKRQFQQLSTGRLALVNVVNPELAAFAGMFGDRAAILTGDSDFHG